MAWIYLVLAGMFEIAWAITLKYGVSNPWKGPLGIVNWLIVLSLVLSVFSILLLYLALRDIPVGTAYAVWTGIGAVGVAALGMILYDEPRGFWRFACMALIVLGIVGLKLTMPQE